MTAVLTRAVAGARSEVTVTGDVMTIDLIYVPAQARGAGQGTAELVRLIEQADAHGWEMELIADSVFGVPLPRLCVWYMRHGFTVRDTVVRNRVRMVRARATGCRTGG